MPDVGLRVLLARRQFMTEWAFASLAAPHWRLYLNDGKGAWVRCGGKRVDLEPGSLWVVPPETDYASGLDRPVVHLYVHFLTNRHWKPSARAVHRVGVDAEIRGLLEGLADETFRSAAGWRVPRLVLAALERLPADGWQVQEEDPRAKRLVELMTSDPAKPWSNAALAREAGMHPQSMVRWFKQRTGRTPRAFLLGLRMQEACLRLHHTDESIESIAAAMGFYDRYHFTRMFRRVRGMGPAAYRRQRALWPVERRSNDV